ncbi:MAG: fimbrial biogenesis chaperone [Oceanococcus sp.]
MAALFIFVPLIAPAAQFDVAPTQLHLDPKTGNSALNLSNRSSTPLFVQSRVFLWTQEDGLDKLSPSDQLIASPAIAKIDAGETQTVRVVVAKNSARTGQRSFRLLLDELPSPDPESKDLSRGISVLLRYSVPVFVGDNQQLVRARLTWTAHRKDDGILLSAHNLGDQFAQLTEFKLNNNGAISSPFGQGLLGYVLSGSKRTWSLSKTQYPNLDKLQQLPFQVTLGGKKLDERVDITYIR